ncbi:hypothetical protein, partial [Rhodopirellula bahusiensis]
SEGRDAAAGFGWAAFFGGVVWAGVGVAGGTAGRLPGEAGAVPATAGLPETDGAPPDLSPLKA